MKGISIRKAVLQVQQLSERAVLPSYAHEGDAGLDLFADEDLMLQVGQRALISTGIAIELPVGTEAQIRPRSGLALNHGITVLNAPGTIDAGYRGEIKVLLINFGQAPFQIERGMKIAQMVIAEVLRAKIQVRKQLGGSKRGAAGFGSTGDTRLNTIEEGRGPSSINLT
jgi:dUTP pyrophosphatase